MSEHNHVSVEQIRELMAHGVQMPAMVTDTLAALEAMKQERDALTAAANELHAAWDKENDVRHDAEERAEAAEATAARLRALAYPEAKRRHNDDRDQDLDRNGNELAPEQRHPGKFEECPQTDCRLVRAALAASPIPDPSKEPR